MHCRLEKRGERGLEGSHTQHSGPVIPGQTHGEKGWMAGLMERNRRDQQWHFTEKVKWTSWSSKQSRRCQSSKNGQNKRDSLWVLRLITFIRIFSELNLLKFTPHLESWAHSESIILWGIFSFASVKVNILIALSVIDLLALMSWPVFAQMTSKTGKSAPSRQNPVPIPQHKC